jgi:hypothetical protein
MTRNTDERLLSCFTLVGVDSNPRLTERLFDHVEMAAIAHGAGQVLKLTVPLRAFWMAW